MIPRKGWVKGRQIDNEELLTQLNDLRIDKDILEKEVDKLNRKISQRSCLYIKAITLVKSDSVIEKSHCRFIAKMSEENKKTLDPNIYFKELEEQERTRLVMNQNSIYLTQFRNQNCIMFNFLNNTKSDDLKNIILEHQVNIIKLINFGIPVASMYTNFAYIFYNDDEDRGKQIYLKGDKHYGIDINGEIEFNIALDEVTNYLKDSVCTLESNVYASLNSETELLYNSISEAGIKYKVMVISIIVTDISHRNHFDVLILDASTGYLNVIGFIEVEEQEISNIIDLIEENIRNKRLMEEGYFFDLIRA